MEKYGFVYIWFDKKRRKFYIGCRWGNENDNYICSSTWMRNSYRRRSHDFKRRILKRVYTNRIDLLEEEHRWLKMIPIEELGKRYYNLRTHHFGHWSTSDKKKIDTINKQKTAWTDEKRQRAREQKLGDKNPMKNSDVVEKVKNALKAGYENGRVPWNTGKKLGPNPLHSQRMKEKPPFFKGKHHSMNTKMKLSKHWKVIAPDGTEEVVHNLNLYCENHKDGLNAYNMRSVAYGIKHTHRGYRCKKL